MERNPFCQGTSLCVCVCVFIAERIAPQEREKGILSSNVGVRVSPGTQAKDLLRETAAEDDQQKSRRKNEMKRTPKKDAIRRRCVVRRLL